MSGHIPFHKIDIWLQGYRSIWLSTTRSDGRPHCVPVWYWWDRENANVFLVLHGDTLKVKNLNHQSWVVLNAGNADDTIILQGIAHAVTDAVERADVDAKWRTKYVDPYSGATASAMGDNDFVYRVEVEHIMAWEYGAISNRTDWHFDRTA